jgi:hypothetical protein
VSSANKKKHQEVIEAIYANLRSKRDKFSEIRSSRFYSTLEPEPGRERWIYIDSYDSIQDYTDCQRKMVDDAIAVQLRKVWETIVVPNSFRTEVWSEFQKQMWVD